MREHQRITLLLRDRDWRDFQREAAIRARRSGLLLRTQREPVLRFACDVVARGHIFRRLTHRVGAVCGLHLGIHKSPAKRGIEQLHIASERRRTLAEHIGRARHRLDPSRHVELTFTRLDSAGRIRHGGESARAESVHGLARNGLREPSEQERHARDVAIVLTRLIRTPQNHIGNLRAIERGVAREE